MLHKGLAGAGGLRIVRLGSYLSGAINVLGILLVSKGFSNELLAAAYPAYFSAGGCFLILLWGCAYIAAASAERPAAALYFVFAAEKLFYVWTWLVWFPDAGSLVGELFEQDPLTGLFLYGYWVNDLFWAIFFAVSGIWLAKGRSVAE